MQLGAKGVGGVVRDARMAASNGSLCGLLESRLVRARRPRSARARQDKQVCVMRDASGDSGNERSMQSLADG